MSVRIDAEATLALRRDIYSGDAAMTRDEFARLLAVGAQAGAAVCDDFVALAAEAAVDLLVLQAQPHKYVSQQDADWFVSQFDAYPGLGWRVERAMLVGVSRSAVSLPPALSRHILRRFESVATQGHIAADGADHEAGVVTEEDLEALRVALFSATEGSALHITRDEAEALFRIAQATHAAANAPGFDAFFAKAVGNYLMGIAYDRGMTREQAASTERWLNAPPPNFGDFVSAMMEVEFNDLGKQMQDVGARVESYFEADNAEDAALLKRAAPIDATETGWLMSFLTREGELTGAERALLRFLRDEAPDRAPALDALIAAKAA